MTACRVCGAATRPLAAVPDEAFVECPDCGFVFAPEARAGGPERAAADGAGAVDPSVLAPALARLGRGPHTILDFGCGESPLAAHLRRLGHRVVSVDAAAPRAERSTGPLETAAPGAPFDLVYAVGSFERTTEPRTLLHGLLPLLRPGGLLLVHTEMETPERERGVARWWRTAPAGSVAFYRHATFAALLDGTPDRIVLRDPRSVVMERA